MDRYLSLEERKIIEKKIKEGLSLGKISHFMGRSPNGIIVEVRKNGGREEYKAIQAHENSKITENERKKKVCENLKKSTYNPFIYLKQKIEILEMQLEIIIEQIKEIKKNGN